VVTAAAVAAAADDTTVVVATVFGATTDEVAGGFGGSCDFAPYSMYCNNTETSNHHQLVTENIRSTDTSVHNNHPSL